MWIDSLYLSLNLTLNLSLHDLHETKETSDRPPARPPVFSISGCSTEIAKCGTGIAKSQQWYGHGTGSGTGSGISCGGAECLISAYFSVVSARRSSETTPFSTTFKRGRNFREKNSR